MSKDAKDPKHRSDSSRQPQRKDSLSSILSWAALHGKITASKTPPMSSSASQSPQTSIGNGASKPRRHSHSASTETKPKARRGSTTLRKLSLSNSPASQVGPSTKTRHAKTSMAIDPKASPGTSKSGKDGSSEEVSQTASESTGGKDTTQTRLAQGPQDKPRSASAPIPIKSILRVSSPDGSKRPRQFVNPETGEPISPGLPASCPEMGGVSPDSPPGSDPTSPMNRPMSPGATVRFAKATIHRVEVGPGRRFLPVKRKSKSTLTYISPLDPGTQQSAPKTMLQSPTKLRRHQENQKAMGRYWMRTEEEEAQWRAEAERRAQEEAERYRNEPASPPPASVSPKSGVEGSLADKVKAIDKLPPLDSDPSVDKVDEELADSEISNSDEDSGVKCDQGAEETESVTLTDSAEGRKVVDRPETAGAGKGVAEEPKITDMQAQVSVAEPDEVKPTSTPSEQANREVPNSVPAIAVATTAEAKASVAATQAPMAAEAQPSARKDAKLAECRCFSERLAEKQAAEERAEKAASPVGESKAVVNNKPSKDNPAHVSSGSFSKDKTEAATGRSSSLSTSSLDSSSSSSSTSRSAARLRLAKAPSRGDKGKESEENRERPRLVSSSTARASSSPSYSSKSSAGGSSSSSRADRPRTTTRNSHGHGHGSSSSSSSNHLHLSGRRGRRYSGDHRQGILA
ncbi:hypothetical protein C8A03DRAFT_12693 [Achaetomium macrosporum]|uniref:Uncharacterized protein n=1 Tax=Achaetomium macrosporum TaxID=79813 RepID=A0AAN7CG43_9PEZI|nr:hypothetical protein C8A03DRAFT_12693 [Achaetomium macrosporum]